MLLKKKWNQVIVRSCFYLIAIIASLTAFLPEASAVPAWARKTGLPCMSCHVGGSSRLNQLGRDFQLRGHRLKMDGPTQPLRWSDIPGYISLSTKLRHADRTGQQEYSQFQTGSLMGGGPLTKNVSFFGEYVMYDRLPGGTKSMSGMMDGYLQYADNPTADNFNYLRVGNVHPYAVYTLGTGGRFPLTRARALTSKLGGIAPEWNRRAFGVSGGYVGAGGVRLEAGIQRGAQATFAQSPDLYLTAEKDLDAHGSQVGIIGSAGSLPTAIGIDGSYSRAGLMGRYQNERTTLTGTVFTARVRNAQGAMQTPGAWFIEAGHNVMPELTAFARYEDVEASAAGTPHVRGVSLGITQRIPNSGRVVLEYGNDLTGIRKTRSVALDFVLMY